jgi:hypothetical protein
MNYFKKIIDWVITGYEPEFRPKKVYHIKGKTYYLRKRKKNASSKSKRR